MMIWRTCNRLEPHGMQSLRTVGSTLTASIPYPKHSALLWVKQAQVWSRIQYCELWTAFQHPHLKTCCLESGSLVIVSQFALLQLWVSRIQWAWLCHRKELINSFIPCCSFSTERWVMHFYNLDVDMIIYDLDKYLNLLSLKVNYTIFYHIEKNIKIIRIMIWIIYRYISNLSIYKVILYFK